MPLSSGDKLGPYEILSAIGAGGMGEVYRAKDTKLGRQVAIKVLPGHLSANPSARERLRREASAAAAPRPPNSAARLPSRCCPGICPPTPPPASACAAKPRPPPRWTILLFARSSKSAKSAASCSRSEERRVGKECRSRWSPYH